MEKLLLYTNFVTWIAVVLIWTTIILTLLITWIGSKIENERFFKSAMRSLDFSSIDEVRKGISNDFEVYRNHRFGFKSKTIIELCQELERKIKLQEKDVSQNENIRKLESVISILKDEYKFDDEKMNQIITNVQNKADVEEARKLREYLIGLNAYHDGIIYEKDRYFKDFQEKSTRKKWGSNLGYAIGIIGSLSSICSLFLL